MQFGQFRKSTRSDGGSGCVEVAKEARGAAARVRDSKDPGGPVLEFRGSAWLAFVGGVTRLG